MDVSQKSPETVVLIHGLGRSTGSMRILAMRLRRAGFETADTRYHSRRLTLHEATADVAEQIEEIAARRGGRLHLVGHSLGGIIALRIKRERPDLPIHRVVQFGSPNRGSGLAELLKSKPLARRFFGPVLEELACDLTEDWSRDPDVAAFAGVDVSPRMARLYGVQGPNDGMVSARSAWGRDAGVRLRAPTFHGGLPLSRKVAQGTIEFLKTGHAEEAI